MKTVTVLFLALSLTSAELIDLPLLRTSDPDRRITNGHEATPGQFPYQAVTLGNIPGLEEGIRVCGATILTRHYLLTCAHCHDASTGGIAIVGAHSRIDHEESQQRFPYTRADIHVHPDFTGMHIRNDIATINIIDGIDLNDRVQLVRLPARSDDRTFSGMMATISGFGRTSDDSGPAEHSPVMRYTLNPILTNADCLDYYRQITPDYAYLIQNQNLCHSNEGGRGFCGGDGGGPLTVVDGSSSLQVGIASFGSPLCEDGTPMAYVRVSYFLDWIEESSDWIATP